MSFRGFTYRLKPNALQEEAFLQFGGVCRLVWNLALEQRREHWRNYQARTGDNLNYVTQARELTALRRETDFIRAVSQTCQQYALKALDDAYRRFFKGLGGYPQPKKKGVNDAFTFNGREITVERLNNRWGRVRLPKIGWVKFRMTRNLMGKLTKATVCLTPLGWQISIGCKDCDIRDFATEGEVGIDRGVAVPLMLSNGTAYMLPERLDVIERRARKAQRILARRKRGSNRHALARKRVAALKAKAARIRKHWAHETTTAICRNHATAVIERLRTRDMTASAAGTVEEPGRNVAQKRGLNRAILNVGWHQIETLLFYKAHRVVKVDPHFTSQTCSRCGAVDSRNRKNQAFFVCTTCGFHANADHNAAINILHRGNTPVVEPQVTAASKRKLHPV
ncbi:RNA-guided endonuclease InsQ/TnpB family protein [Acetobacter pasteurianus]|uniref:RNA-guided endonuclease InsQ/TnpB family protein n=1 Tax=Acetobacter pasteurianus TaxID=438 RepID=UPI0003841DB2|nr:RNA-guided endonuclease TnpB family protein [Acetobacter pasteurianus]CCT58869.1 ISSoc9, transposase [Acetobacter pasteurianus 386B]